MKARACYKCWQFVDVDPTDAENQEEVRRFEKDHMNHALLIMEQEEIKGRYTDVYFLYAKA